ncbi:MAG: YceD family protein [Flavobacteriales bacterium]
MDKLKNYDVSFVGLKNGVHQFDFKISKEFFDLFEFDEEFENPQLRISLFFEKKDTILDFNFKMKGDVSLYCDITTQCFCYKLDNDFHRIVKFGDDYVDEGEDIVIVPYGEHTINVAQWIYENFMLSLPAKRVHPEVLSGKLKTEEFLKLEELQPQEKNQIHKEETDPRWDKLKDLLK